MYQLFVSDELPKFTDIILRVTDRGWWFSWELSLLTILRGFELFFFFLLTRLDLETCAGRYDRHNTWNIFNLEKHFRLKIFNCQLPIIDCKWIRWSVVYSITIESKVSVYCECAILLIHQTNQSIYVKYLLARLIRQIADHLLYEHVLYCVFSGIVVIQLTWLLDVDNNLNFWIGKTLLIPCVG